MLLSFDLKCKMNNSNYRESLDFEDNSVDECFIYIDVVANWH